MARHPLIPATGLAGLGALLAIGLAPATSGAADRVVS